MSLFPILKSLGERNADSTIRKLDVAEDGPPAPLLFPTQSETVGIRGDDETVDIFRIYELIRERVVSKSKCYNRDKRVLY